MDERARLSNAQPSQIRHAEEQLPFMTDFAALLLEDRDHIEEGLSDPAPGIKQPSGPPFGVSPDDLLPAADVAAG